MTPQQHLELAKSIYVARCAASADWDRQKLAKDSLDDAAHFYKAFETSQQWQGPQPIQQQQQLPLRPGQPPPPGFSPPVEPPPVPPQQK